jgi:hypothetical protein
MLLGALLSAVVAAPLPAEAAVAAVAAVAVGPTQQQRRALDSVGAVNTSISFYNVGACSAVAAVKFDFDDPLGLCPSVFQTQDKKRCHVPGPYGREVFINLWGVVDHLVITVLDPSDDDANLTAPTRISLAPTQRRNLVGASVRPGVPATGCALGFTLASDAAISSDVAPTYFRSVFHHLANGVGAAKIVSNGDSTIGELAPGQVYRLDQKLVTAADMPDPVRILYESVATGAVLAQSAESTRLWGSTCERAATAFVLYGRPPELPLSVLRLDGAGPDEQCSYDEATTSKFTAELTIYNTVASSQQGAFIFAFGLSPFLPYDALQTSVGLAWTEKVTYTATQPGEIYVKAVDAATGSVRVLSQRVPLSSQRRNLMGIYLDSDGSYKLDLLQASDATHTASAVASGHFRLLFSHAALTLPSATITANDDLELASVAPGGRAHLDHPLLPPHQAGRLLKISFLVSGGEEYSALIDLSTLCDGAAYALVLVGTLDRLDSFDPILTQVGGTATECSLSAESVHAGTSSSLALTNMASRDEEVRFEWGSTLLSLTRQSVPLGFRESVVTDVPVGDLFVRLLRPDPPYEPLTSIITVDVHEQARNALIAHASGAGASPSWSITDVGTPSTQIGATATRVLLLNYLEASAGGSRLAASASVSGGISDTRTIAAGGSVELSIAHHGGASVSFHTQTGLALGSGLSLAAGTLCAQSVQLVLLSGVLGEAPPSASAPESLDLSPQATHVDGAAGYCRLVVPQIPDAEELETSSPPPPPTTTTLDIFGENGPGDGGLLGGAAPGRRPRGMALLVLPPLLLLSTLGLLRGAATER